MDEDEVPEITVDEMTRRLTEAPEPAAAPPAGTQEVPAEEEEDHASDQLQAGAEETDEEGETQPEADAPEAPLVDAEGKYLGKYETPEALAKAYKEAEKLIGKKGETERQLRLKMQENGWTFDVDGNPVAPTKPAQVTVQDSGLPPGWRQAENGNRLSPDGVEYDYLGMPVISDEDWREQFEQDPVQFDTLRRNYFEQRDQRLRDHTETLRKAGEAQRGAIVQQAKEQYHLPDELIAQIMDDVDKTLPHVDERWRNDPAALSLLTRAAAFERLPAYYNDLLAKGEAAAIPPAKNKRIISHSEQSTVNGGNGSSGISSNYGLTAEQIRMSKALGVSLKDYAANQSK
jgi:uncharacterized protein YeaO (DUF488 family)